MAVTVKSRASLELETPPVALLHGRASKRMRRLGPATRLEVARDERAEGRVRTGMAEAALTLAPSRSTLAAVNVRPATVRDLALLADVELRAAASFAEVGLAEAARWPTVPAELLARQQTNGLVWVVEDPPVGFAVALVFQHALHLQEIDVVPEARGRGMGRALIDAVSAEAARRGLPEVTLVTFRDVPWNAPYYARQGFVESPEAARRPEIAALLEEERRSGLAALGRRVVMVRSTRTESPARRA